MVRVKKAVHAKKYRKSLLKATKGYRFDRSTKERAAQEAYQKAGQHAFAHRRDKKGLARRIWNIKINAALRTEGQSYSKFIGSLKKKNITIDRKILSTLASEHPEIFKKITELVK